LALFREMHMDIVQLTVFSETWNVSTSAYSV